MKKVLLIGGTGVLSSAVVQTAIQKGLDVTIVTRGKHKLPQGVSSIVCD
jgi:nucleoside-diphosphate-sugar epimerase